MDNGYLAALLDWFDASARELPWRKITDPYAIWVSEIMLQQTQVATVIPYWNRWMEAFPNIHSLSIAEPSQVLKLWQGLGYYSRARNLQSAAQLIQLEHAGVFPQIPSDIINLPGVGRYTAGAIGSIAFNQPVPIVDGNVLRILTRFFGIVSDAKSSAIQNQLWHIAAQLVSNPPEGRHGDFNQAMMELGALVCLPRAPRCNECPWQQWCYASRKNVTDRIPHLRTGIASTHRYFVAIIVFRPDKHLLIQQRPSHGVNANFWEFPVWEVPSRGESPNRLNQELGETFDWELCGTVRHSITRYRMTVDFFSPKTIGKRGLASLKKSLPLARWVDEKDLLKLPLVTAHARALKHKFWLNQLEQEAFFQ